MDNEIKNLFEVLIIKNLKSLKKEVNDDKREQIIDENNRMILQYQNVVNISCREAEIKSKVKATDKDLDLRESELELHEKEIDIRKLETESKVKTADKDLELRKLEIESKVKTADKDLELREKEIDIHKLEIGIKKEQLEIESKLEKAKIVSTILSGVGGILSFGLGVSKLSHQNTWINKGIEFEKTGTWSTKTISNVFNNSIKV